MVGFPLPAHGGQVIRGCGCLAQVNDARVRELGRLGAAIPARVGMQTLLFATPVLAAVASFAVYGAAAPASFTAARIFSSIALFGIMRIPLVLLPFALVEVRPPAPAPRNLWGYRLLTLLHAMANG